MASLKELRRRYREDFAKATNLAKSANFPKTASSGVSQISQFSRVQQEDDILELQFLRDERTVIREYDGGMTGGRADYRSHLDVPALIQKPKYYDVWCDLNSHSLDAGVSMIEQLSLSRKSK